MGPQTKQNHHQRVKEIFSSVIEIAPEKQAEFLQTVCGTDENLLREVESLLKARNEAGKFLEDISAVNVIHNSINKTEELIGKSIDKYKIVRELGKGGMGIVFLAERQEFHQQAALKIIKRGMDSEAILERFHREREILAALNHPFIARLIDGGTTDDNLPFFVMEYVEGVPVDEYCRQNHLPEKAILELFRKICEAVSFAHQKLVVHRDLKPSNILVTAEGMPKLLDFGIAKLLNSSGADKTQTNQRVLTPAYASPEQLRGETVDTTSDIYSLGKILSGLLQNRDKETHKNFAATQKNNYELQTILDKSMREETVQRYPTAEFFSEDIRRYLTGLPIEARPLTSIYRLSKFLRRHRMTLTPAAIAVFLLAFIGGIFGYESLHYAAKVKELETISKNLNDAVNPKLNGQNSTQTKFETARAAVVTLSRLENELGANDRATQINLADAYVKLGNLQDKPYEANIGDAAGARISYENALKILQRFAPSDDTDYQRSLANAEENYAYFLVYRCEDASGGMENIKKAINRREAVFQANPKPDFIRRELAQTLIYYSDIISFYNYTSTHGSSKSFTESLPLLYRAVNLREGLLAENPSDLQLKRELASAYQHLSRCLYNIFDVDKTAQSELAEAITVAEKSLLMRKEICESAEANLFDSRQLADQYLMTGIPYSAAEKSGTAMEYFRRSQEIFQTLAIADPQNLELRRDTGNALLYQGLTLMSERQNAEAHQKLMQARQTFQSAFEKDHNESDEGEIKKIDEYLAKN